MLSLPKKLLNDWGTRVAGDDAPRPVGIALLLFCLVCLVGVLAIRLQLLFSTQFPINDGALFYAFMKAVAGVFPALPSTVEYNDFNIPFAYPPLSFWLAAAAVQWGVQPLGIVHYAPILMNMAYVAMFALLLLRTGHSLLIAAAAVLVLAASGFFSLVVMFRTRGYMGASALVGLVVVAVILAGMRTSAMNVRAMP